MKLCKQQQLTDSSCVAACLAIVTGADQQQIIGEMAADEGQRGSLQDEFRQWVRLGYLPSLLPYNLLQMGEVIVATVPSLNVVGGNHRIVIDCRGDGMEVIDPNEGRPGKKFYTVDSLHSWTEATVVQRCASPVSAATMFPIFELIPQLLISGYRFALQDSRWWLFDGEGEGVTSGESFRKLCVNILMSDV